MKQLLVSIICFGLMISGSSVISEPLLIKNITVVSPELEAPLKHANVLIEDGRISQISNEAINAATNTTIVDGEGKFLTPGFIDSHVHLSSLGGLSDKQAQSHADLISAYQKQEPRSLLYFGVTTVVDLKKSEPFVARWQAHNLAPDLVYCQGLPYMNGYGMKHIPENERFHDPYFIYDERQSGKLPDHARAEDHNAAALVAKVASTSASCIKTAYESGFSGLWNFPTPTNEQMSGLHDQAKTRGLTHVHHGNSLSAYRQAAAAKIDVIAHGLWHWEEESGQQELPDSIKSILDQMITNGTRFQLTAQVLESELRLLDGSFFQLDDLEHSLPAELIKWHSEHKEHWYMEEIEGLVTAKPDLVDAFYGKTEHSHEISDISHEALRRVELVTQYLVSRDAVLLLGSDTPSSPSYSNPPGLTSYLEVESLFRFGVPLESIFAAATINNARAFGLDDEVGSVEVGKKANLLILNDNPLQQVAAYKSIETVILAGEDYSRADFSAGKFKDLTPGGLASTTSE